MRYNDKIRSLGAVQSAARIGTRLEAYLNELARLEVQARSCYAHSFEMTGEMFLSMLLLDSCYLLVRFSGVTASNGHAQGRYETGGTPTPLTSAACGGDRMEALAVVRDAFYLAENQVPFFIIDKVHRITFPDSGSSAAVSMGRYVAELLMDKYSVVTPPLSSSEPGNLLHLLHLHFKPSVPFLSPTADDGKFTGRVDRWRTATEYYFAGIKFKKRTLSRDGACCILDVKLNSRRGVLEVPRLNIDAETWRLLRNLMALEQRNPEASGSHVTAYCVFMSQLACTPSDVELLSRSGVIAHGLGNNDEVARCFTDLCKGIMFSVNDHKCNYLRATCQALDKRVRRRHPRWMAWLRQKYFRNPWLAFGLAAAVVGLVCSVVQAVYSILSYKQGAG